MAVKSTPKKVTPKASKGKGFTAAEKSAMQARVKELQSTKGDGEAALVAKIAEMQAADRAMAKRVHAVIKASAPALASSLWYGMPAYTMNGRIVCHFQPAQKFKTRYPTLGFSDKANLDQGGIWPVAFALADLGPAEEATIAELVKKAIS